MKLIIDIDEDTYKSIIEKYGTFPREWKEWGLEAIRKGIPLENIKTEIYKLAVEEEVLSIKAGMLAGVQIIDKYMGGDNR